MLWDAVVHWMLYYRINYEKLNGFELLVDEIMSLEILCEYLNAIFLILFILSMRMLSAILFKILFWSIFSSQSLAL